MKSTTLNNDDVNEKEELTEDLSKNAVYRTLRILESLSVNQGKTLDELAPIVGLSCPTLFRFLLVMQKMDYVEKNEDNRYRLKPKLFAVATRSIEDVELTRIARPYMEDTSYETGETTVLGIRDGDSVLHVQKIISKYNTRFYERVGKRNPLYCTTMGKMLLAGMSDEEFDEYLSRERLIPYTSNTITDPEKLKKNILLIKERGYAESVSEFEQGIHGLACPIWDNDGDIIAAIDINWPLFRETPDKMGECLKRLKAIALQISVLMGYVPVKA